MSETVTFLKADQTPTGFGELRSVTVPLPEDPLRVTCRPLGQIDFESVPGFTPERVLYTTRKYPCGCAAAGRGDVPNYCPDHGTAKFARGYDSAKEIIRADFDKAQAVVVKFGLIGFSLVAGWILAKIF